MRRVLGPSQVPTVGRRRQASRARPLPTRSPGHHRRAYESPPLVPRQTGTETRSTYLEGDAEVPTISIRDLFPNLTLPSTTEDNGRARALRHEARRLQVRLLQVDIPAISASTRLAMTLAMSSTTSLSPRRESAALARPSKKSPPRMVYLFPNAAGADGAPRRRSARSITSSCNSDATCIISTICASRVCVGSGATSCASAREDSDEAGRRDGGEDGGGLGGRGGTREKTEAKEAVWSGMLGFQSFSTSGRESGRSSSSARPPAPSHSAAHFFWSQSEPRPLVAREKRRM